MSEDEFRAVESLRSVLSDLKSRMVLVRKQGIDTSIAELMIHSVPAKIRMASITKSEKDVGVISKILERAGKELDDAALRHRIDRGMDDNDVELRSFAQQIEEAESLLAKGSIKEAEQMLMRVQENVTGRRF